MIKEPVEDEPLKSEDVEVGEEDDHVDEGDVRPRERALPSYIKKEKPIIRFLSRYFLMWHLPNNSLSF